MSGMHRDAFRAPAVSGRPCESVPHGQIPGVALRMQKRVSR